MVGRVEALVQVHVVVQPNELVHHLDALPGNVHHLVSAHHLNHSLFVDSSKTNTHSRFPLLQLRLVLRHQWTTRLPIASGLVRVLLLAVPVDPLAAPITSSPGRRRS